MKIGEAHGHVSRVRSSYNTPDCQPHPVYTMPKDYKPIKDNEVMPATRLVCVATSGPNARLSNVLCMILNVIADFEDDGTECRSTEEMKAAIGQTNINIKSKKDIEYILFSMDVKALYPSLNIEETANLVYNVLLNSEIVIEEVDMTELGQYLRVVLTEKDIEEEYIEKFLPIRRQEVEKQTRG